MYYKYISLESLDLILSNGIIFIVHNLYYIGKIDVLGIRAGPVNWDRGSTPLTCEK
jgi:hypothetical protein